MFLKKSIPGLYAGLGIFLPLITTNCAVFGVCVLNVDKELGFLPALVTSFGYAAGFGLALIIFTASCWALVGPMGTPGLGWANTMAMARRRRLVRINSRICLWRCFPLSQAPMR